MIHTHTKALICNLEGTLIPFGHKSMPSEPICIAIEAAHAKSHIVLSTNRTWERTKKIAQLLTIKTPIVTLGGSQVVDPLSGKVVWEQDLDPGIAEKVVELAKTYPGAKVYDFEIDKVSSLKTYKVHPIMPQISIYLDENLVHDFVKQVKKIPLLLVETSSTTASGVVEVTIKHIHATKFMALQTVSKKLGLNPKECVGVGDSANDITLLNFCGTKIAMGNANERLKELAHHVAPGVDEDGLAWVIERFVLSDTPPPIPLKER